MGILGGIGIFIIGMGMGSALQREKLLDEWKRIEGEWMDLAREKERWRSRSQKL